MCDSNNNAAFIWSIANLLRGEYKQADYGRCSSVFEFNRSRMSTSATVSAQ
jgi:hypothetical protein